MVRTLLFLCLVFSGQSIAQQKTAGDIFGQWHETHGIDKFPCMNKSEEAYFTRLIQVQKNEEKKKILADHRKVVKPSPRMPAAISANSLSKGNFICPPFRGVRNPYPAVKDFGTAAQFERIHIQPQHMQIINGLSRDQKWPHQFHPQKGYFEGKTPRGTPTNIIPLVSDPSEPVRFVVQYLIWQDKTPPTLTLCYREDLHKQCNPYAKPGTPEPNAQSPSVAQPGGTKTAPAAVKKVGG